MLIICPKCFTQYQISDENASLKGKKCHCSACGCYFEQEDFVELKPETKIVKTSADSAMEIFEYPKKEEKTFLDEPHEPISLSLFNEPLKEEKEPKFTTNPFDYVPEEFKPVPPKKTSLISLFFWLGLGVGICYFAYLQKDYLLNFMNKTIETKFETTNAVVTEKKSIMPAVKKVAPAMLDQQSIQQVTVEKLNELPQTENASLPVQQEASLETKNDDSLPIIENEPVIQPMNNMPSETQSTTVNQEQNLPSSDATAPLEALQIQNISYEIGVNEVGIERLLIKGVVVNTSIYHRELPLTKAVIYDLTDRVVARKRIVYLEKVIDGNSEISFETSVVPAPQSVSKIEVNFDE